MRRVKLAGMLQVTCHGGSDGLGNASSSHDHAAAGALTGKCLGASHTVAPLRQLVLSADATGETESTKTIFTVYNGRGLDGPGNVHARNRKKNLIRKTPTFSPAADSGNATSYV